MPKLEEIDDYDDIDNMDMDLAELDSSLRTPIAPKLQKSVVRSQDQEELFPELKYQQQKRGELKFFNPETGLVEETTGLTQEDMKEVKHFQVLYPCYFDKNRTHKEGRRVPSNLAVENPLAMTISEAVRNFGLLAIFEGDKTHPQDFGNPGRVRVLLKTNGQPVPSSSSLNGNKRRLMKHVSQYLKNHPTTLNSLKEIPYGPDFDGIEPKPIPRVKGLKMNSIVPLHSPFLMGHPMTKSVYDAPKQTESEKKIKMPKNKYKVIRR